MDCMTPEQRHKAMVSNRSKNTSIEVKLRKALWNVGIRYRKNYKLLNYNVDIAITKYKVAIFCDGDFWHGKDFDDSKFHTNKKFWSEKIKRNMERDLEATIALRDEGWQVLRFWEKDIKKSLGECVKEVVNVLDKCEKKNPN